MKENANKRIIIIRKSIHFYTHSAISLVKSIYTEKYLEDIK